MAYNDVYKLVIHQRCHGQEVINKLHFVQDHLNTGSQAQQLADDFRTSMDTTLRARAGSDLIFEFVEVQQIVPFGAGPAISVWPANTFGQHPNGYVPTGMVAEVITIYTQQAGRRKRGRIYLSGVAYGTVAAGSCIAAQTTRTTNFATAMAAKYMQALPATWFHLGVWSRAIAGPTPPWSTDAFAKASGLTVRTIVRTQRRRQIGVGR